MLSLPEMYHLVCESHPGTPPGLAQHALSLVAEDTIKALGTTPPSYEVEDVDAAERYSVRGGKCTCGGAAVCEHVLATEFYAVLQDAGHSAPTPVVPVQSTHTLQHQEPHSFSAKAISPKGFEWLICIRSHKLLEALKNCDIVEEHLMKLGWRTATPGYLPREPCPDPSPAPQPPTVQAATPPTTPVCPHHGAGKESGKAAGTYYCPKKMADGSYCKWRWPNN